MISGLFKLIGLLTVLAAVLAAGGLYYASERLPLQDVPAKSDAIVVLGGSYYRPLHAAELYREGYAPLVYLSVPVHNPVSVHLKPLGLSLPKQEEMSYRIIVKKGVPPKVVRFFGTANRNTVDEAVTLRQALGPGPHRLLLVTSPLHCRRARIVFQDVFPASDIRVVATSYESYEPQWWTNLNAARAMLNESVKILAYWLWRDYFLEAARNATMSSDTQGGSHARTYQSAHPREEPLPAATCPQPRGLASVGSRGL
jgi:uncharacterized SAM-binding protein YcdF (DUF218 family)